MHKHYFYLALPFCFAVVLSGCFGLGVDEAHYMLYAKFLDWSYFDHPPLVGWVHWVFNFPFGWTEFSARLPAILLGYLTTLACYKYLLAKGYSSDDSFCGALSISFSFIIFALNLFLLPDSFLLLGLFILIKVTERVGRFSHPRDWVLLGIVLGVLGLAKYTSVLFVLPVGWYLLEKRGFKIFRSGGLYLAVATASVLIAPILYWNFVNEWISFMYQLSHVSGGEVLRIQNFLESLAGQVGAYNPFLFPFAVAGFFVCLRNRRGSFRLEIFLLSVLLIFFLKSSFGNPILPHWTSPFFVLAIPIGVANYWRKYFRGVVVGTSLIFVVLLSELVLHWIPQAAAGYRDIYGYDQLAQKIIQETGEHIPVAVTNWTYASRVMFYLKGAREVFVLDDRKDQFDLWMSDSGDLEQRSRFLLLLFSFDEEGPEKFGCLNGEEREAYKAMLREREVYSVRMILCKGPTSNM